MARIAPVPADDPQTARIMRAVEGGSEVAWNVTRTLANSLPVLRIFRAIQTELPKTSLSRKDREVIDLQMAVLNGCHYCIPAHITLAREGGLDEADIKAIVERREVAAPRARVVQRLVHRLVETKGKLTDDEFAAFQAEGVAPKQMIEVIAEIAHCTLTNYTNRLAQTDLDDFLEDVRV